MRRWAELLREIQWIHRWSAFFPIAGHPHSQAAKQELVEMVCHFLFVPGDRVSSHRVTSRLREEIAVRIVFSGFLPGSRLPRRSSQLRRNWKYIFNDLLLSSVPWAACEKHRRIQGPAGGRQFVEPWVPSGSSGLARELHWFRGILQFMALPKVEHSQALREQWGSNSVTKDLHLRIFVLRGLLSAFVKDKSSEPP